MSAADELPAILLISGSDFLNKSIKRLSQDKFTVLPVADADQAWKVLTQKNSISIVLIELLIAVDKNALLHRMRSASQGSVATLPILVLVSEGDEDRLLDIAFAAGATDYIDLPFSSDELCRRIRMHTGKYLQAFGHTSHQLEDNLSSASPDGLLQQGYFISRLDQELLFSTQHKQYIACAMLKIDNMEEIVKTFGKNISKAINNAVARIIGQQIRGEDAFCYFGNNTFAILYPVTNGLSAQVAIKRIMTKISAGSFQFDAKKISITVSAGLFATQPNDGFDSEKIVKKLEDRLKQAEELGGNKVVNSKTASEQEIVSLERGLKYIRTKQEDKISGQLPHLLDSVYPLLAFARKQNKDAFDAILNKLQS